MPLPTKTSSPDEQAVAHVFISALQIGAQDIRITLYRPANDVSINFRIVSASGRTELVRYKLETDDYCTGWRLVGALFGCFCSPPLSIVETPPLNRLAADLHADWSGHFGLDGARAILDPLWDGRVIDGYVVVVNLHYSVKHVVDSEQAA